MLRIPDLLHFQLVEATPLNIRLRKRILDANVRKRSQKTASGAEDRGGR